jgi:nucleobase:cation symporter-1, NCS1 family
MIFWVAQLPFLLVPPQRVRFLFLIKSILVPSAWLAVFAWSVTKVPTSVSLSPAHTNLGGTKLSWAWLNAVNSAIASYSTLCVNIPDFTVSATAAKK